MYALCLALRPYSLVVDAEETRAVHVAVKQFNTIELELRWPFATPIVFAMPERGPEI